MSAHADAARSDTAPPQTGCTRRQVLVVLSGLPLGMFPAAPDLTAVSTAVHTVGGSLGGPTAQAWAAFAFLIASAVVALLHGKPSARLREVPLRSAAPGGAGPAA